MISWEVQELILCVTTTNQFTSDDVHEIIDLVESEKCKGFILDLKSLTLLSSSHIGYLVSLYRHTKKNNFCMAIAGLSGYNLKSLELAGLITYFPSFPSITEGLKVWPSK